MGRGEGPKVPHRKRDTAETVWILTKVQSGEHDTLAVCRSADKAQTQAMRVINQTVGVKVRDLSWAPSTTGGQYLVYARDRWSFHFRVEPWPLDAEVG